MNPACAVLCCTGHMCCDLRPHAEPPTPEEAEDTCGLTDTAQLTQSSAGGGAVWIYFTHLLVCESSGSCTAGKTVLLARRVLCSCAPLSKVT